MSNSIFLAGMILAVSIAPAQAASVSGEIAVYKVSDNTLLGYVSDVYDSQNSFTFTVDIGNSLIVNINTPVSAPFAMLESNPPGTYDYFGAVGGSGGYDLTPTGPGYTYLSGSALTAAGATPSTSANDINSLGYEGPDETTIWSVDGSNIITGTWVNADSTQQLATTFYDPVVNYLGLTGDLAAYNGVYSDGAYAVNFVFTGTLPNNGTTPEPASFALFGLGLAAVGFKLRRKV